jgi:hypothetical protein
LPLYKISGPVDGSATQVMGHMTIEEKIDCDEWTKYVNNDGHILGQWTQDRAKVECLAHWVLMATDGEATILDLQGN